METNPEASIRIVAMSGSLRRKSYNTAALYAAGKLIPPGADFDIISLDGLPLFNADIEQSGAPPAVTAFREALRRADGLMLATPEYNFSISAVLKNALEWASRPPNPPLYGKPCALLGVSTSPFGTARGQLSLRQVCVALNLNTLNVPYVDIPDANAKYDESNRLTDETALGLIKQLLNELCGVVASLKSRGR
jgi:chromate reductase, NAD(P)H dehydrogenase (quinone)